MKTKTSYKLAAALSVLLLAAACGSVGDVLGTGNPTTATQTLHGTVDSVDSNSQSVVLTNVTDYGSSVGNTRSTRVYYDNNTTVDYQGRSYRPTDLERGDQIDVRYNQTGSSIVARSMTVTYDVAQGTGTGTNGSSSGSYGSVRGTVQYVDTSRQTLQINTGTYGGVTTLSYDQYTTVTVNGRSYRPQDLRVGDQIDVTTRWVGNTQVAQSISVTSNGTTGGGTTAAQGSVQGTVNYVDTNSRTIQLTQAVWGPGFTTGNSQTSVTLQYDASTYVDYQGQSYPPTNLERGDVVNIEVRNSTIGNYLAGRITVMRNVRG